MVRATIAWGNVVTGDEMNKCLDPDEIPHGEERLENVMVGMPFSWCQDDEKLAPPFGIFIHASLREHTQGHDGITVPKFPLELPKNFCLPKQTDDAANAPNRVGWVLDRWWGEAAHEKLYSLPFNLYRNLLEHIAWLKNHPVEAAFASRFDETWKKSLDRYQELIDEYFSRFKDVLEQKRQKKRSHTGARSRARSITRQQKHQKKRSHTGEHDKQRKRHRQKQTEHSKNTMGARSFRAVVTPSSMSTAPSAP